MSAVVVEDGRTFAVLADAATSAIQGVGLALFRAADAAALRGIGEGDARACVAATGGDAVVVGAARAIAGNDGWTTSCKQQGEEK